MDFGSLETWGYLAVAFFAFGGSLFIVAAVGVFSFMGKMDLTTALVVATLSNYLGDMFLFYLGRYQKKRYNLTLLSTNVRLPLQHLLCVSTEY